jgi:hypothetical protein
VGDIFIAAEESGLPIHKDTTLGDSIGTGMAGVCIHKSQQMTAANAYFSHALPNLTVVSDALVSKCAIRG